MSVEDVVKNLHDYFTGSVMETQLDTIEAARSVQIPRIKESGWVPQKGMQYPQLEVLANSTQVIYSSEDSPLNEGWESTQVDLVFTQAGNDAAGVIETLMRYQEAVKEIIRADYQLGGLFDVVYLRDADWTPIMASQQDGSLIQVLFITVEAREVFA